jgi:hypothetical protein
VSIAYLYCKKGANAKSYETSFSEPMHFSNVARFLMLYANNPKEAIKFYAKNYSTDPDKRQGGFIQLASLI